MLLTRLLLGLAAAQLAAAATPFPRAAQDICGLRPDSQGQVVCRACASRGCDSKASISSASSFQLDCYCPDGEIVDNSPYAPRCSSS